MSLWEKYLDDVSFSSLKQNIEVDTLIIGGGIAGLTTLYYLKDLSSICLVDASLIGVGVTKNTTGKLNYLQGMIYTKLTKNISKEAAIRYLHSQKDAILLLKEIVEKEKIKCDLEEVVSYVFTNKEKEVIKLKQEKNFLESQQVQVEEKRMPLAIPSKYSFGVKDTYVFNPIKYLNALKQILKTNQIYENTKIEKIAYKDHQYFCYANGFVIKAKKVIVACHYPFFLFPMLLPLKSHIEKSYLIARPVKENLKFTCITASNPGLSCRYYQDGEEIYQICLARSHHTAIKQNDVENFQRVKEIFNIQEKEIAFEWSNMDIMTDDELPYMGEIKNHLYLATGFNTWGMTNGILAARLISDLIIGNPNKYQDLFSFKRKNFYQFKSFFSNVATTFVAFIGSKKKRKSWYKNNLEFKKLHGKSVAVYTDENHKKHMVYTTCPHLKCSLIFNEKEKTWDCPCHSSRFSIDGKCIKGPSVYDISYKE